MNTPNKELKLAIFPFENLTGQAALDVVCKSFYTELITELSRFRQFSLIAFESLSAYEKLDIDYSIRGSFGYQHEHLRIHAQLVNEAHHRVAWANRYNYPGEKEMLFSIQEDMVQEIVSSLQLQLNHDMLVHSRRKLPINFSAYEHWLNGMEALKKGTLEADEIARDHFNHAVEIDPGFSLGYSGMSLTYFNEWSCQLWERWDVCQKGAYDWARKAYDLDDQNYVAAFILGRIYLYEAQYEKAETYLRRALALNANDTEILTQIALAFVFLGDLDEAESLYKRAVQLNPLNAKQYNAVASVIAFEKGNDEESLAFVEGTDLPWVDSHAGIAASYYNLHDLENMERHWQIFLQVFKEKILKCASEPDPAQALQWVINVSPFKHTTRAMPFWEYIAGRPVSLSSREFLKTTRHSANSFLKEHGLWLLSFDNKQVHLPDMKGFYDLAKLLANPEQAFHCTELMNGGINAASVPAFDEKAKRVYQKKILELQEEIRSSENNNDYQRSTLLHKEYDDMISYLSSSLGLRGRVRSSHNPVEKVRSAVTWRIRSAIRKIENAHPTLGKHLSVSIQTGVLCVYRPEKPMEWTIS